MSFLFSQPAPGVLPANSVDFTEVETISANRILGNNLGTESTIKELQVSDVATMLNLSQYAVGAASSIANSIPLFSDNNGKILVDNSGWVIVGSVLRTLANGNGKVGSNTTRVGEAWFKDVLNLDSLSASQILASDGSKNVVSLDTATYPSLTELSYVKGVTSAIQTQLDGKASTQLNNLGTTAINTNLLFGTDNTHTIGIDGASRPSSIHAADHITTAVFRARDNDGLSARNLTVRAGNSSMGNGDGGNLTVAAGTPHGTGTPGSILLQSNGATRIELTSTGAINVPGLTASSFAGSDASKNLVSLSAATATSYLNTFTDLLQGVVPASGGGTTNFLRADGQWQPAGVSTAVGDVYKVLASNGTTTTWQFAGLGDGSYPSNTIVLGRGIPSGMTSTGTVLIGVGSGKINAAGNNNTIIGSGSATAITSASSCTIVGQAAATAVTTATNLTSVGMNSCLQLTTGGENTVFGYLAGSTNSGSGITTGSQNVCIGARAAVANGTDSNATAVGFSCSAGISSVAVGQGSYSRGTGGVAIGAGAYTGTNNYNTVIGYSSLQGLGIGQNGGNQTTTLGAFTGGGSLGTGFGVNTRCLYLGTYAGSYSGGKTDEFMLDNQSRGSYANTQTKSLLYGVFNATETSQTLRINAQTQLAYGEKHASVHAQTGTTNVITATVNNYYIGVDSTLAAKTVNLPAAATAGAGFVLVIKDEGGLAGTNNITIDANGAELIDGATTQPINTNYGSISLMCSGTAWFIM